MRKRIFIILLGFTVYFVSCKVGKQYQQADYQLTMPSTYNDGFSGDTTALVKWFDLFGDTALQSIIKTTLANNNNLLLAANRVQEAMIQTAIIRINQYPSFNYQAQVGGGTAGNDALRVAGGLNSAVFKVGGLLNWEIDLWGKLRGATAAAQAEFLASAENVNAIKVSLVAEAASLYFLLRDLDNRLLIAKRTVDVRKESTTIITQRYEKGYVAELDKFQAVQQEMQAAVLIPNLERQIVQTENAINLLMATTGKPILRGQSIAHQQLLAKIPAGLPSQLLQRRPDIKAAEKLLNAQFERVGIAQASMYPSFSLTGLLGFASPQVSSLLSDGFVANGFGGLVGPIFQFNQNRKRVELEKTKTISRKIQYDQVILASLAEVNNALIATRTFEEEYSKRQLQVDAGKKALVLSNARYNYGYTSYLEVLTQENILFEAELQESILMQQKLNALVSLYRALGGGWN